MQQRRITSAAAIWVLGLAVASGCEDPKQRIALLEDENQGLYEQLELLRAEMDAAKQQRDRCQDELLSAQQLAGDLRGQLSARPQYQPQPVLQAQPVDLPGEWQAVPGGAMLAIPGNVLFASGKTTLKSDSKQVLSRIASEINSEFSSKDIFVFGHTDNDPIKKSGWKDNRELSSERALAVVRFLQGQGVAAKRLVACGWGEYRPVASNTTKDGKARNRRVEIYAVDPTLASN